MAFTKQISVFLSNKSGRIADVTTLLAKNGIDLKAISVADGESYGSLRIITSDYDKSLEVLKAANFITKITDVLTVEVGNRPGALAEILSAFDKNGVSVEYLYTFVGIDAGKARIVIRVNDNDVAERILNEIGIELIGGN